MTTLAGQVAAVTGAGSGVGKAIALALAREGVRLCLMGRRPEALEEVAGEASSTTSFARAYPVDLASETAIADVAARVGHDVEGVDILVHSAGIISIAGIEDAAIADFDRQYEVNLRAPYRLTQALLPMMKPWRAQVVFVNSSAGIRASRNWVQYAATKHGLKAVADGLREEVNPRGIRVLSVFLGRTATPMQASIHEREGRPYSPEALLQPEDVAAVVVHALGLPFTAEVTDINIRPLRKAGPAAGE